MLTYMLTDLANWLHERGYTSDTAHAETIRKLRRDRKIEIAIYLGVGAVFWYLALSV